MAVQFFYDEPTRFGSCLRGLPKDACPILLAARMGLQEVLTMRRERAAGRLPGYRETV